MKYQLKSVAMHITNECGHKCPMCYATSSGQIKCEGKIEILKAVALELKKYGVEEINLVGGNPCDYSKIQELTKFLSETGFQVIILSNTHVYKNSTLEEIVPFVSSLEGTIHAETAKKHDAFCDTKKAYTTLLENLKRYSEIKEDKQQLGIIMNVMKHNYKKIYQSVENILAFHLPIDYVLIQRIGPYGKADGKAAFKITEEELIPAFEGIDKINRKLNIPTSMVDAYPYCKIPKEYHKYLSKCDWGYSTAAIDMNGNLSRCALSQSYSLGNVLKIPVKEIWQNSPVLKEFRSKNYLDKECQNCKLLTQCGGGCPLSCGDDTLSSDVLKKSLTK